MTYKFNHFLSIVFVTILVILTLSFQAYAESPQVIGIEIVRFGQSKRIEIKEIKKVETAAAQDVTICSDIEYIEGGTNRIPGKQKAAMGVTCKILGRPNDATVTIEMRTIHPPIKNPKTKLTTTKNVFFVKEKIGRVFTRDYEFTDEWEIAPGEWIFEFWCDGQKLAEKKFIVYKP